VINKERMKTETKKAQGSTWEIKEKIDREFIMKRYKPRCRKERDR